jgi:hypothetical protein
MNEDGTLRNSEYAKPRNGYASICSDSLLAESRRSREERLRFELRSQTRVLVCSYNSNTTPFLTLLLPLLHIREPLKAADIVIDPTWQERAGVSEIIRRYWNNSQSQDIHPPRLDDGPTSCEVRILERLC